jgi:hypothetical protein
MWSCYDDAITCLSTDYPVLHTPVCDNGRHCYIAMRSDELVIIVMKLHDSRSHPRGAKTITPFLPFMRFMKIERYLILCNFASHDPAAPYL